MLNSDWLWEKINMKYRVFIIEDNQAIRSVYHQIINREIDIRISGEAASAAEGLTKLATVDADVIVLDLGLPDQSGLALLVQIKQQYPSIPVLVVSGHLAYFYRPRVLKLGASGYIDKMTVVGVLANAIRITARGHIYEATETDPDFQKDIPT
ncbi:MAG: response regulator transcription factor [Caldilineaceae bacterium]